MTRQALQSRFAPYGAPCRWIAGVVVLAVCVTLCGCSGAYYRRTADRDAYAVIAQKTAKVPGMRPNFSLTPAAPLAPAPEQAATARPVSLAEALTLAEANNRDFQSQRESLYLQSLDLVYARHLWTPIFSGTLAGAWRHTEPSDETTATGNANFSVSQLLWTGGEATLSLATNLARFVTGDPRRSASSLLDFAARQHLWRGAGVAIAMENLTQAERDMIYALRSFVRFKRQFDVQVASSYYNVLQQRDVVENVRLNMESLTTARGRAEMMAEAGRMADFEVAQARQQELSAKDSYIRAQENYQGQLDAFKIQLGLPIDASLELDPKELLKLRTEELPKVNHTREEVADIALKLRLDLATTADGVSDADRKVKVARDNLNPGVDLLLNASLGTEDNKALGFTKENGSYGYGVAVDLPLNQMAQRNAYRASLITLDKRKRDLDLNRDQVRVQINDAWRKLEQVRQSCEIQTESVKLAERRVDNTDMLVQAQRATIRDLLDSQQSLLDSRNQLTGALVAYRITLLQLWRDMEALEFKDGQFTEEIPRDYKRNN